MVARVNLPNRRSERIAATEDRKTPKHLEEAFSSILAKSPFLERLPNVEKMAEDVSQGRGPESNHSSVGRANTAAASR